LIFKKREEGRVGERRYRKEKERDLQKKVKYTERVVERHRKRC